MEQLLKFFIEEGARWVREQRDKHRADGRQLDAEERQKLGPYFTPDTLNVVAVNFVPVIVNPGFYTQLQQMGRPIPLDFTAMWGITFIDTIVLATTKVGVNSERLISLLFHECVHICQYQQLGLHAFMERYVLGWAQNGFQYEKIPLEEHAYYLQNKFETTAQPFSVDASVQIQLHKI